MFYEEDVLGNSTKLIRKYICRGLFFYKVADQAFNFCKDFQSSLFREFLATAFEVYQKIRDVATTPANI